jgi:hypothetical protein
MSSAPVLALSDFALHFIVETNASDIGIGAVSMQKGQPIAYFNQVLGTKTSTQLAYHKDTWKAR